MVVQPLLFKAEPRPAVLSHLPGPFKVPAQRLIKLNIMQLFLRDRGPIPQTALHDLDCSAAAGQGTGPQAQIRVLAGMGAQLVVIVLYPANTARPAVFYIRAVVPCILALLGEEFHIGVMLVYSRPVLQNRDEASRADAASAPSQFPPHQDPGSGHAGVYRSPI